MINKHLSAVITIVLILLNLAAAAANLFTGNIIIMGLNVIATVLLAAVLKLHWDEYNQSRKRKTLLG